MNLNMSFWRIHGKLDFVVAAAILESLGISKAAWVGWSEGADTGGW